MSAELLAMAGAVGCCSYQRDLALATVLDAEYERLLQSRCGIGQGEERLVWTLYKQKVFDLAVTRDVNVPLAVPEAPLRYAADAEIHHIFREDPKSPPKIITLVFAAAVAAAFPVLLGLWATLGANVSHLSKALGAAPLSHALFFGSIIAMEGVFFLYYTSWNLFQTLPAAGLVGVVAFLSGSRALSEVQERRLAGLR